jgi:hypothetical protein
MAGTAVLVRHKQGEQLHVALDKACTDAIFISLPQGRHGSWTAFLANDAVREAATIRTTSSPGCAVTNPKQ